MNQREGLPPPAWLNGQTIAIVGTVLTVGVGIGAMVFASTSGIRGEISGIRGEVDGLATKLEETRKSLSAEIRGVRSELSAEIKATRLELSANIKATRLELKADIGGLDARLRTVEQDVAVIKDRLPVRHPATHGAAPLDYEKDDADA